jgi:folate-binding protein YgfZ
MPSATLHNRSVVHIGGADSIDFLQGLVTCNVENLHEGGATFGALLTPQGKILFDFFVQRTGDGFLIDCPRELAADLRKRLMFYRLRAAVTIEPRDDSCVRVFWGDNDGPSGAFADPRHSDMGFRLIAADASGADNGDAASHDRHRIDVGMPLGGVDFTYGDAFPHEVLMDQFMAGGVDFRKGCYVGQEVVSRMQHRGTARKRVVKIAASGDLPPTGTSIIAGGKITGTVGSICGSCGLALVRLDRIAAARHADQPVTANDTVLDVTLPSWTRLTWPQPGGDSDE